MKRMRLLLVAAAAMAAAGGSAQASSATRAGAAAGAVMAPRATGGVLAPLSASECQRLGGTVVANSVCNTRTACARADQSGKVHQVCLSQ